MVHTTAENYERVASGLLKDAEPYNLDQLN